MATDIERVDVSEEQWRRAFEIHKNCDQLLHQRLTAFTGLQAFAITAYAALTVARFQQAVSPERIIWFEVSRVGLISFGIITAIFGWMVTFPMLVRLRYLNDRYLKQDKIYLEYIDEAHRQAPYNVLLENWPKLDSRLRARWIEYRNVIPILLPLFEILLWLLFLLTLVGASISTWAVSTA